MQNLCAEWRIKLIFQGKSMIKILSYLLIFNFLFAVGKQQKVKTKFSVIGIVYDKYNQGLNKVKVSIIDENGKKIDSGKTGKDGEFEFKKIPPGSYLITGSHKEEGTVETEFSISTKDIDIRLEYHKDIENEIISENGEQLISFSKVPEQREAPDASKLKFDDLFFEYETNLKALETEIDSLKNVVKGYEKGQTMPNISREILEMIKIPDHQHQIELQNGTVVSGELLQESDSTLTLKTQIGTLVLKKEMVVRMNELEKPGPKVIFLGDPFIDYYPNKQIFSGRIKNIGQIRADFVRVIGNLFDQTTENTGTDSIFVKGTRIAYDSNVVADTALEPGQTASYTLTVSITKGKKAQYHTMDIHWDQTR